MEKENPPLYKGGLVIENNMRRDDTNVLNDIKHRAYEGING
ncbi:hypothetical protein SAMN06264849_108102 [Melghirimyces algeriensis]|uniref:Uncharacterized protein n=1 Tax=Melghirimyces algeriensis TaxID=910412 RepID=A0A521E8W4_9BACL|nr:hypothetical protein SAMN06264849_108102 [Melghirimyces algeriensis]